MKKLQVAVAVGTLLAAGAVSAATISQSGVTIAREVIVSNTQTIVAPTATFTYDGALSSNANSSQDFNIVLKLGNGAQWSTTAAGLPDVGSVEFKVIDGGVSKPIPVTAAAVAGKATIVFVGVEVVTNGQGGLTVGANTALRYKFRLANDTAVPANLAGVQVNFNVTKALLAPATVSGVDWAGAPASVGVGDMALVKNLFAVNGTVDNTPKGAAGQRTDVADLCSDGAKNVTLTAYNFTGSGIGAIGESTDSGKTNNGYILLDQALSIHIGTDGWKAGRTLDPTAEYKVFTTDPQYVGPTKLMSLGSVNVATLNNAAWDVDLKGQYYDFREDAVVNNYADLDAGGAPQSTQGKVDVNNLTLKLVSSNGFAEGSSIFLSNSPSCGAGAVVSTDGDVTVDPTDSNKWTVEFSKAQLNSVVNDASVSVTAVAADQGNYAGAVKTDNQIYICYSVDGLHEIPQSTFSGTAYLVKDFTAKWNDEEQNNVSCPNPLNGLGGGVKIDVRNFLPYQGDSDTYIGIVRVINNSEKTDADLTGQYIRADGKYGKWGSLGTLPARGARYYTNQEIAAKLVNNSTTGDPVDNSGAGGLTAAAGEQLPANTRLRISSTRASTLRVQNYFYHKASGALTEVSSSQGADFVNVEASDRDHIDQDAQTGIKK